MWGQFTTMLQAIYKAVFKQKKKLIVAVLALVFIGVLFPSIQPVFAGWLEWGCVFVGAVCTVPAVALGGVGTAGNAALKASASILLLPPLIVSSLFLAIIGGVSSWVIGLTLKVSYLASPAVTAGWPIVRNFANIIIVLALIIISLATILRYREYEAKKLLPSLIIAALLINFSLVICGLFIDGSNLIVKDFLSREGGALSSQYSGKALTSAADIFEKIWEQKIGLFQFMARMAGHIFYNTMAGVVLLLYLFLFLFRVIALWILLILSPLAFACYILPTTRKFFDTWWSNFIQWIMIGMTGSFFYWLASSLRDSLVAVNPSTTLKAGGTLLDFTDLISFIVPGTFLVIGFMFAIQTSAMGSGMAISGFKKTIGTIRTGATAGGKFLADNTGLTRAKNAVVDRATRIGENIGLVSRGTADANRKARQTGELDEKGRVDRAKGMSATQKRDAVREVARTREAQLNKAAVLKEMTKEEFGMLTPQEQMSLVQEHQQYGLKPHEMVGKMSTENQNEIARDTTRFNAKTREEAVKALAAKGQLDSSLPGAGTTPGGALTHDEIVRVMQEARANGSDLKDIIGGLQGEDLARIISSNHTLATTAILPGAPLPQVLDGPTRAKMLKALADKKQTDLLTQSELMDEMTEAQINGLKLSDIVGKLSSENQLHIVNSSGTASPLFNEETRGKAVEALMKKGELNNIPEAVREVAYREAIESGGVDAEDLENKDYRAGSFNNARLQRNGATPAMIQAARAARAVPVGARTAAQNADIAALQPAENAARNEVLDENIGTMSGDQLRDIDHNDLTYARISRLTPEKIRQFQNAIPATRTALKNHITALNAEAATEDAAAATARGLTPPDRATESIHTTEANRLRRLATSITNLP